jgi:hypothetical protein
MLTRIIVAVGNAQIDPVDVTCFNIYDDPIAVLWVPSEGFFVAQDVGELGFQSRNPLRRSRDCGAALASDC